MLKAKTLRKITDKMAFCAKAFNKLKIMAFSIFLFKMKDKIVLNWIYKNYGEFIDSYKKNLNTDKNFFFLNFQFGFAGFKVKRMRLFL